MAHVNHSELVASLSAFSAQLAAILAAVSPHPKIPFLAA
jgi:hypothetical protein